MLREHIVDQAWASTTESPALPPRCEETALSRYFFHLRDGVDLLLDEEGRECADIAVAAALALEDARSIISDEVLGGLVDLDRHLDIETADGAVAHRLEFRDAVRIVLPPDTTPL